MLGGVDVFQLNVVKADVFFGVSPFSGFSVEGVHSGLRLLQSKSRNMHDMQDIDPQFTSALAKYSIETA